MTGKSHTDDEAKPFALAVMQYMNDKCKRWKEAEDIDYLFDQYLKKADEELTLSAKAELLKKALEFYRGSLFPTGESEHWILNDETNYKYKVLGVHTQLMEIYFQTGNYVRVEHYAEQALAIEPANEDAYYWIIRVLRKRNSNIVAKGQLHMAKHMLDEKEYNRLLKRLEEDVE